MKRKLVIIVLSVALTLSLIPTLAAYADELDQNEGPDQILEEVQGDVDGPDAALEDEEGDLDEEEALEEDSDLPKINLKSPVTQMAESEKGLTYTLEARVGEKVIDPALITWTSDDESVATVSAEGVVTIIGVGKANITAMMIDSDIARNGYAKVFVFADKTKKAKKHK
jgi:Bacterial Ig-like domain (group 2)